MTKEKAIKELKEIQSLGMGEDSHIAADGVLVKLLISLGYEEIIKEYHEIEKWYA